MQTLLAFGPVAGAATQRLEYQTSTQRFRYVDSVAGTQSSTDTFPADAWHHVFVVIGADNSATLYVDGNVQASFSTSLRPAATDAFVLGQGFGGLLDDVAVYDLALSPAEVKRHYRGVAPVLRLGLDDSTLRVGGVARDDAPYDNTVTVETSAAKFPATGAVGAGAYDFSSLRLDVAAQPHLDLSDGEFTQMAWVNLTGNGGAIFGGAGDIDNPELAYPSLRVRDNGTVVVGFGDGTTAYAATINVPTTILTPNSWHFVAATFDGTTYTIYVDGQAVGSTTALSGQKPGANTTFQIGYGAYDSKKLRSFDGLLDEVALYRQALSPAQIAALYHQGWRVATLSASGPGVAGAAWSYVTPGALNGPHQIRLRSSDGSNLSYGSQGNGRWDGYIGAFADINVTGLGQSIASGDLSPTLDDNTDFGPVILGSPAAHTFRVENVGGEPVTLTGASPVTLGAGASFTVTGQPPATVGSLTSEPFTITFTPTGSGPFTDTVILASDDQDEAVYTFAIQGVGCPAGSVAYVDANVSGGAGSGASWVDAFAHLQDALSTAVACPNIDQVWVADGIYYPDLGVGQVDDDRSASFQIPVGVTVLGGFAGTESTADERDRTVNTSILSGDIDGDGDPAGNSRHVVVLDGATPATVLDGFTLRGGNADGSDADASGGGLLNTDGSPTLLNLLILANSAVEDGGGMANVNGSPTLDQRGPER